MSYELEKQTKMKCPCGKGLIVEGNYSNDWFQNYDTYSVDCEDCKEKYHIEEVGYTKPDGEYRTTPYLVPNGDTLVYDRGRSYNLGETPFYIQLCMMNDKKDLEHAYEILKDSKYYSKLEDDKARYVCDLSKKSLNTVKIKIVLPHLIEAIEKYDSVENNCEIETERVAREKERVATTKEKSICLYELKKVN